MRINKPVDCGHVALVRQEELDQYDNDIKKLKEALSRQCDNIAFVINNMDVPGFWYGKFKTELEADRELLNVRSDK